MGGYRCCVSNCRNHRSGNQSAADDKIGYHKFPNANTDQERFAAWVLFAGNESGWMPKTSSYICSNHFAPNAFEVHTPGETRRVKRNATPTIRSVGRSDFQAKQSHDPQRRLEANVIPTVRTVKRILPEKRTLPTGITPGNQTLTPHVIAEMQKLIQATVKYTEAPSQDGDFDREKFLRECLSSSPSVSDSDSEDDDMFVEEHEPPATEIRFTYSILRAGLSLVTLPSEWNVFMDDDDFVMFFRIDKASYEITHAVIVAADLVPTIRIHNLLYSGNEFGRIPLENFWCLKELLLSLSYATICPGLESNFDGGCALVYKGGAALCPACKARKRVVDQRARNNADNEPEEDSTVRKYTRRKKRRVEECTDMENLDQIISSGEVGLPNDGIPFNENIEGPPLKPPKRLRRSAKKIKHLQNLTANSLPVEPLSGTSEELPASNSVQVPSEETGHNVFVDSLDVFTPEDVGIMSNVQQDELCCSTQDEKKILKKICHLCGFVADPPKWGLTKHMRRAHPECAAQWTVECMYCERKFSSEVSMKLHVNAMHKDGSVLTVDHAVVAAAVEHMKTTGIFNYYCAACRRHYISKAVFDLHQFQHSPPDTSNDHPQRDCPACDFHAPTFSALTAHMADHALRHKDKKPCLICGKYLGNLRGHFQNFHPDEMRRIEADWTEQCEECGEKFKWKRMLEFHKRTVHNGFQCLYCAKRYYTTREFGDHVLEHKVDGVFPCPLCDNKYAVYPKLSTHYRSYHDITRAQYCTVCRKPIPGGDQKMSAHMKCCVQGKSQQRGRHKEMEAAVRAKFKGAAKGQRLPCDQCGKLLASRSSMSKHIRWVHIGDLKERYEKDREEKKKQGIYVYSKRGYVKPRNRIALEDFPHRCDECQLGYMKEISLIKHRDTRHPEKFADS